MGIVGKIIGNVAAWRKSRTVTIAVAGLSGSGKTAFITSVILNLEAAARNSAAAQWLNGLEVVDTERLQSAEQPPNYKPTHGRMFPLSDMLANLTAAKPRWPTRTANIYEVAIDLRFWPGRRPQRTDAPTARLRFVFVDYPGEWLVDVPLLDQTYAEWSKAALSRLERKPWSDISQGFCELLKTTTWTANDQNELARNAALEWQKILFAAQSRGLKWLQPGQFVRRRDQADDGAAPALDEEPLWFCPLPEAAITEAKKGSLAHAMAGRYAAYRKEVGVFFEHTLKNASHHLLLVDVLEALAEGENAFFETAEILAEVYRVFANRKSGFWNLFNRTGFEKVLLLATKADAVPPNQRAALKSLLAEMCKRRVAGAAGIAPPSAQYMAAIRATEDVKVTGDDGDKFRAVQGLCDDGQVRRVISVDIPAEMPKPDYFRRREGQRTPRFRLPPTEGGGRYGIPNVRVGQVVNDLVGDLLQ